MLFQFLPRLSDDEYTALEKSIREHGIQVPIVVDENDSIIDGHHRKEIADRLGIGCPRRTQVGLDETQKRTLACSLNLDRRHLTREQKRQVVAKSLKADPHLSDRQHADRTGVSPTTAGKTRTELEDSGELSKLDSRTSADGRQRPSTQPTVNTETGEVSDDYLPDDATGEEVTPSTEAEANTGSATLAAEDVEEAPGEEVEWHSPAAPSRPAVTGIDGKTYKRREQPKPRRKPLTDQAKTAGWDLRKSVERLERIAADDRFSPQKEAMAPHLRGHLTNAIEVCQDLLDRINNQEESTK